MKLGTRLFLLTSALVLLAVAGVLAVGWIQAARVARQTLVEGLQQGTVVLEEEGLARYDRLQLLANVFVADANLIAYLAEAANRDETGSILDILLERQQDLGFDFAVITDGDGRVLARTDRLREAGADYSQLPLVAQALQEFRAAGVWVDGDAAYQAVAIPLTQGIELLGYFVTAYRINDETARIDRRLADAHVTYFARQGEALAEVASSLEERQARTVAQVVAGRADLAAAAVRGESVVPVELEIEGDRWVGELSPLRDAAGAPVGAVLASQPLDRRLAPFRRIGIGLGVAGLLAVLLVSGLTLLLATQAMRPVRALVRATAAARAGDYQQQLPAGRQDELGQLAAAFDGLLEDLREKRDMELFVAQFQRKLPENRSTWSSISEARVLEGAVLGIDFRRHAKAISEPDAAIFNLGADLRRAQEVAASLRGKLLGAAGHRAWIGFADPQSALRAVAAAVDLLSGPRSRGDTVLPLAVISAGRIAEGPLDDALGGRSGFAGRPAAVAESLMREAAPGEILLDEAAWRKVFDAAERVSVDIAECRGLATPLRFFLLRYDDAIRVAATLDRIAPVRESRPTIDLRPNSVIANRYEILEELGAGGMGVVYKARDRELDDIVAIKLLRPTYWRDNETFEMVRKELKLARLITHPNVIRLYDLGEIEGTPFLSMEYVRGITLRQLLRGAERLPYGAALLIARQICQGLVAVHRAGVLHCDLKPENVILTPTGEARLMDFGIAQPERLLDGDSKKVLRGTPRYLAPEQLAGAEADVRSDIHACGLTLYELFTGKFPYPEADSLYEVVRILREMEPAPPSVHWPQIPAPIEAVLVRCLRKDPAVRYGSADELLADLESEPVRRGRV